LPSLLSGLSGGRDWGRFLSALGRFGVNGRSALPWADRPLP
jgi:hypothetical protein